MEKNTLLQNIKEGIQSGLVTKTDVEHVLTISVAPKKIESATTSSLISKVLYAIGGGIAIVGVFILIANNWDSLNSFTKILFTLGISILAFIYACIVYVRGGHKSLSDILFIVSAVIAPVGSFICYDELGIQWFDRPTLHAVIMLKLAVIFGIALYYTRRSVLHIITAFFFTWAYYATVLELLKGSGFDFFSIKDVFAYAGMILGIAYLVYSSWLARLQSSAGISNLSEDHSVSNVISVFSFLAYGFFMGSALFLGGFWNFLYAIVAVGAVSLSVKIRSTAGLIVSTVCIGIYVIKISVEYFASSLGWAFMLVLIGFLFIALGYITYYLNKKFIKSLN